MSTLIVSTKSVTAFSGDLNYDQVPQCGMSDMAGRLAETASMNPNIAIEVGRELIPGVQNIQVRNGELIS